MDQVISRKSIRDDAASAARQGSNRNPYPADTEAASEWDRAYAAGLGSAQSTPSTAAA